jgi:predicted dehydrogenase
VGLVGCGNWGRYILRDLVSLGCDVTVVARSEASRERARDGGAAQIVQRDDELEGVEGVVVAALVRERPPIVERLLGRGLVVFTEKPLAADPEVARKLRQASANRLFVMDKWRYHPGVRALASIARSGELGRVTRLESRRLGWGNPREDVDAVWNLAPHDLAIVQEVLETIGEPAWAVGERDGDRPAGLLGVLGGDPTVVVEVSSRHPGKWREVRLGCEGGVAVLAGDADHVVVARDGRDPERRATPGSPPLLAELQAFVEHLRGGPPPASSAAEATAAVEALAALRALAGLDP